MTNVDMDREVLMNILNRVEANQNRFDDKIDKLSTGLTKNTAETEAHSAMLKEMKTTHDQNGKAIFKTLEEVKDVKQEILKINSWKDGQTLYQEQVMTDIDSFEKRLSPIEIEFNERRNTKEANNKSIREIKWRIIERILLVIAGAVLFSWETIIGYIFK